MFQTFSLLRHCDSNRSYEIMILFYFLPPPTRQRVLYLGTVHFAINTSAAVALFLPAAAVGELEPSVVAALPDTYDCRETETLTFWGPETKPAPD